MNELHFYRSEKLVGQRSNGLRYFCKLQDGGDLKEFTRCSMTECPPVDGEVYLGRGFWSRASVIETPQVVNFPTKVISQTA